MGVQLTLQGKTKEELEKAIDDYLMHYPYAGYMTSVSRSREPDGQGYWLAHVDRLRSAD